MFTTFFKFEFKHWLRSPMMYIFTFILGLLVFGATISSNVQIGGSYGNIHKNAPFVLQNFYGVMSIFALFLTTAFMNSASLRDFENDTSQIIFSKPISKAGYYFGHFFGALCIAIIPMLGISIGSLIGTGWNSIFQNMDADRFGATHWKAHWDSITAIAIPNIFFCGAVLYTFAILFRNTMYSFIAALAILMAYIVSSFYIEDIKNEQIAAMLDPFGAFPMDFATKYWTVADKNEQSVGLFNPIMLLNRLFWMAIGAAVLIYGYFKFSFEERRKDVKVGKKTKELEVSVANKGVLPQVTQLFNTKTVLVQFLNLTKTEFFGMIRSNPFRLLTLISSSMIILNLANPNESYGLRTYPITYAMCRTISGSFLMFVVAVITYFAGTLIWKEREAKVSEIYDAMPTQTWTSFMSKYIALAGIVGVMFLVGIGICCASQAMHGYYNFELGVYFKQIMLLEYSRYLMLIMMAMLISVVSSNKYVGFFAFIVFNMLNIFIWGPLNISSRMLRFASHPNEIYSDMNGFSPYVTGITWFNTYWFLFSGLLALVAIFFYVRGRDTDWKNRFASAKNRFGTMRPVAFGLFGLWFLTAGFVFYNTKILNKITTEKQQQTLQMEYEQQYKKYEKAAQPRVTDIKYKLDLFPSESRLEADGDLIIKNKNTQSIDSLFITMSDEYETTMQVERATQIFKDTVHGFFIYKFSPALAAGDSVKMKFHSTYALKGFENNVENTSIVENGSFFNARSFSPAIGYQADGELSDKNERKKRGLPERKRMATLDRNGDRNNTYISNHADYVNLETTISTSSDQTAIAPGSLVKYWTEGNRHYFTYKLDHKALYFFSFLSARFEKKTERENGIDFEVYYDKKHPQNVDRMLNSMKKALAYYTANFGPYQNKQCRIIEFPRYQSFAQAFPGTMPYSESIGFIADLRNPDDIDKVFYVVAHEMGHQYWAHQVCGAEMQGATLLSETFAQYSALMVMEKEYGQNSMRRFLEYEMDDYLSARGTEAEKELPLSKVENQGYIHYRKGSGVMYYFKEMIGESAVNQSLRSFLDGYKYKEAPYAVSLDVIDEFKKNAPDSLQYLVKDLFEDITLFDCKTTSASAKKLDNGKYEVTVKIEAKKFKADELGKESEMPINDFIEIGALAKPENDKRPAKILFRKRMKVNQLNNTYTFITDEKPDKAGVDPLAFLADRMPKDNMENVEVEK
jgi:ABC-2 type transport system permease protein